MADLHLRPERAGPGPMVTGFGPAGFRVEERSYRALLLTVERAAEWSPPSLDALDESALADLLADRPEFLLLGTGPALRRPPAGLARVLDGRGIGLEVMDSRAAARAWGVLRSEGRRVAAALYPLD